MGSMCSVSGSPLGADMLVADQDVVSVGTRQALRLPGCTWGSSGARGRCELSVERVVQAASLSEALSYGQPHFLLPTELELETEEEVADNRRAVTALCMVGMPAHLCA